MDACGSRGCTTTVLAQGPGGDWSSVLDAVASEIAVGDTRTEGFCDLLVDHTGPPVPLERDPLRAEPA